MRIRVISCVALAIASASLAVFGVILATLTSAPDAARMAVIGGAVVSVVAAVAVVAMAAGVHFAKRRQAATTQRRWDAYTAHMRTAPPAPPRKPRP